MTDMVSLQKKLIYRVNNSYNYMCSFSLFKNNNWTQDDHSVQILGASTEHRAELRETFLLHHSLPVKVKHHSEEQEEKHEKHRFECRGF